MTLKKQTLLIYGFIVLIQVLGIALKLELLSTILTGICFIPLFFVCKSKDEKILIPALLVLMLATQNFIIGISAHIFHNTGDHLMYMTQIASLCVYVVAPFAFIFGKKNKLDLIAIILVLLMLNSYLFTEDASLFGAALYFRNYSIFYCFFVIGRYYITSENYKQIIRFFVELTFLLSFIGIVFLFLPFSSFVSLGIKEVYIAKAAPIGDIYDFEGRFTTTLIKTQFHRVGSIMYEPINFAYFSIPALLISSYHVVIEKKFKLIPVLATIMISFISCFSKGAILIVADIVLIYILDWLFRKNKEKTRYILDILSSSFLILVFSLWYNFNIGQAATTHFNAIAWTFEEVIKNPIFGYGLGTGGNYGSQVSGWLESGGESFLMGMIYQVGIVFTILFAAILFVVSYKSYMKLNPKIKVMAFLPVVFLTMSLLQENTFTPQCICILMIIMGASYSFGLKGSGVYDK